MHYTKIPLLKQGYFYCRVDYLNINLYYKIESSPNSFLILASIDP